MNVQLCSHQSPLQLEFNCIFKLDRGKQNLLQAVLLFIDVPLLCNLD